MNQEQLNIGPIIHFNQNLLFLNNKQYNEEEQKINIQNNINKTKNDINNDIKNKNNKIPCYFVRNID